MNTQEELESLLQEAGKWKELERVRLAFTFGQRDGAEKVVKAVSNLVPVETIGISEDTMRTVDVCVNVARLVLSDLSKDNK